MKFLDLFAGVGGFHLGMERAGHMCVGACEKNEIARQIYRHQFPYTDIYDDVREIDGSELPEIDCITAGFPCQPFSLVGRRGGFDEPGGDLFFEVIRIAKKTRCKFLFLENVPGLLYLDGGKYFHRVLSTLDDNGYDAEWQMLSSKYHTGQNRQRIFIIAYLRSECRPEIFPVSNREQEICGRVHQEKIIKESKNYKKIKREEGTDNNNLIIPIDYRFANKGQPRKCTVGEYGDPAHTVLHHSAKIMTCNNGEYTVRNVTPVEMERLQGFPDNWTKYGKQKDDYLRKEIADTIRHNFLGRAVTVPVITMIANRLIKNNNNNKIKKNTNKNKTDKIWVQ